MEEAIELTEAAVGVAHLARELAETAEPWRDGEQYLVDGETMRDLRDALKRWSVASEAALRAIGGRS